jgi:hypothetical protein
MKFLPERVAAQSGYAICEFNASAPATTIRAAHPEGYDTKTGRSAVAVPGSGRPGGAT